MSWQIEYMDRYTRNINKMQYDAKDECYEAFHALCKTNAARVYILVSHRGEEKFIKNIMS